uniref:WEB family protein n=1 Tax=Fagus sylvatica TaxID=28930 RepID=A0A2N9ED74_FAGSY
MLNMGEVDTKPIEPVQVALSLFGEKGDQRKSRPTSSDRESENEKEVEDLSKDLANYKVQLDAKDATYKQALLKLEHYQKTADEFSNLLKNSEIDRDLSIDECIVAETRIDELESKMKEMADQLVETTKIREQLSLVLSELKATQSELLAMETEFAVAIDSNLKATKRAELMEIAANMEKEKTEELLKHISDLSEAIDKSKLAAIQAQDQLEDIRKQIEMMQELENQLMAKSIVIDTLHLELKQAKELLMSSEKSASDIINNLNQLQLDLEEEVGRLNCVIETLTGEMQKVKAEMDEIRGRETGAQIEIALLKAELHKGKSKIAAAEAAEERAKSAKSGLYLAVRKLAVEAQEAKEENQRLKGADKVAEETENSTLVNSQSVNSLQDVEASQIDELKIEDEEKTEKDDGLITISMKEYESLITKSEKADHIHVSLREDSSQLNTPEDKKELETLKKELDAATAKIGEFRNRAEQAVSRAELAEKAKAAIEEKLRKWQEQKQRRKAALAALREESARKEFDPQYDKPPTTSQPLGKVLNMKF